MYSLLNCVYACQANFIEFMCIRATLGRRCVYKNSRTLSRSLYIFSHNHNWALHAAFNLFMNVASLFIRLIETWFVPPMNVYVEEIPMHL